MTYLFKLVRRLAMSRGTFGFTTLVLLAACASDSTSPEGEATGPSAAPVLFRISPQSVTIETGQRVQFSGEIAEQGGRAGGTSLVWKANGGTMSPLGSFSSATVGTFKVIALGRGKAQSDSAVVRVVAPQPSLQRIEISPQPVRLAVGSTRTFSATGHLPDGSTAELGVTWAATGGTIDPAGAFTADSVTGLFHVIATNTAGTVSDTVGVTVAPPIVPPGPTTPLGPPFNPSQVRVIVRPSRVALVSGGSQQYGVFGRTASGDSVGVGVTFQASGGTISPAGLYTAGNRVGTFKVIARAAHGRADTAVVTVRLGSVSAPGSTPGPTPAPPPIHTGELGVPFGMSELLSSSAAMSGTTMSLDGYSAGTIITRLADARRRNLRVLMNMTGGKHSLYMTNGRFDLAKWQAKMNTYNTPGIKAAVAAAVADGTIIGNSVMDEPANTTITNTWGPAGTMTKARVDQMCAYVKTMFPTLPVGVVHDHRIFEPEKNYAVCDFVVSQYRMAKTSITEFRDGGLAFARRSHVAIAFSLNILHGGAPGTNCPKYGNDVSGLLCPMSPDQIRQWGWTLGSAGCALNTWRYEQAFVTKPENQAAFKAVGDSLGRLSRRSCTRG